ncbi:MAG TPA: hypothetical protein VMQ11_05665 [Alphaproteobacteria bacterium]|nr:hypothetical protein [Alphaproteobacteria bacterium]
MKPVESNVSPYLQQPLRTMDEVRQDRERRQREELAAIQAGKTSRTPPTPANDPGTAPPAGATAPKALVDQTA